MIVYDRYKLFKRFHLRNDKTMWMNVKKALTAIDYSSKLCLHIILFFIFMRMYFKLCKASKLLQISLIKFSGLCLLTLRLNVN